jgi:uncharacterized membrane protein YgcG
MSGFTLKPVSGGQNNTLIGNIQKNIRTISFLGTRWDDKLIKNSHSVGITEATEDTMYNLYGQQGFFSGSDIGQKEFIAFYDREYATRREFLRKFATNCEIENVIEVIADETIIYDDANYFAYPNTKILKAVLKEEKAKEIIDDLNEAFKKVYYAFGFNNGHDAWHYLKKFLIDGFLSYEIIYDEDEDHNATTVIGFKELDPISLEPEMKKDVAGNEIRVWTQYRGDTKRQRELLDANIIYISWARSNFISRLSYVERLVRSFNMMRTMENSRIIWNVINSQYRMKLIVPIGTQSEAKAKTRLAELRAMYKEDITIADQSGEITINGSPNFSFAKTYIIPSKEGTQTEISSVKPEGYDLSGTDSLKYFWIRFMSETKVPQNRISMGATASGGEGGGASSGGSWSDGNDGIAREEMRFSYFVNRIRSMFQEIMLKPVWIQFVLKHPEFKDDLALKGSLGLLFVEENLFTVAKQRQIAQSGATIVTALSGVKQPSIGPDGAATEEAYFDPKFLVEKYMQYSDDDLALNEKYKNQRKNETRKLANAYARLLAATGTPGVGDETAAGSEFGGGGFGGGGGSMGGADLGGGAADLGGGADLGDEAAPEAAPEETPEEAPEGELGL